MEENKFIDSVISVDLDEQLTNRNLIEDKKVKKLISTQSSGLNTANQSLIKNKFEASLKKNKFLQMSVDAVQDKVKYKSKFSVIQESSQNYFGDPLKSQSYLSQIKNSTMMQKLFVSPFDYSEVVQTLSYSKNRYITVQRVKLNTWHHDHLDEPNEALVCEQGHQLTFNDQVKEDEIVHCSTCSIKLETNFWQCEFEAICSYCFSTNYMYRRLVQKLYKHKFWIPHYLELQNDKTEVMIDKNTDLKAKVEEEIAVIGLWITTQNANIQCHRQLVAYNPIFFPVVINSDQDTWEKIFLHKGEQNELFFFQYDQNKELSMQILDLHSPDKSPEFNLGRDIYKVQKRNFYLSKDVIQLLKQSLCIENNMAKNFTQIKLINQILVFQANDQIIFYSNGIIRTLPGLFVLKVQNKKCWVLCKTYIKLVSLIDFQNIFEIQLDSIAKEWIQYALTQPGFQGYVHLKDKRCTLVSQSLKSWVTLEFKDTNAKTKFKQDNKIFHIAVWQEREELILITGMLRNQLQIDDAYQKFELTVFNQSKQAFLPLSCYLLLPNDVCGYNQNRSQFQVVGYKTEKGKIELQTFIFYEDSFSKQPTVLYALAHSGEEQQKSQPILRMWYHVNYPLIIHSTYHPLQNKIAIGHFSMNQPKKIIDFGSYHILDLIQTTQNNSELYFLINLIEDESKKKKNSQQNVQQHLMNIIKYTTAPWPLPILHPDYQASLTDKVEIIQNKLVFQGIQPFYRIIKAILFQTNILFIQLVDQVCIFQFNCAQPIIGMDSQQILNYCKPVIEYQMCPIKLINTGQYVYGVVQAGMSYNILRFSVVGHCITPDIYFEQNAKILHLQINQDNQKELILYDIEGKIKLIKGQSSFVLKKQLDALQREMLSFLENHPWSELIIDQRTIQCINPKSHSENRMMIISLTSDMILSGTYFMRKSKDKETVVTKNSKQMYFESYQSQKGIDGVRKHVIAMRYGFQCYFQARGSVGTRRVDLISQECQGTYLIGDQIFVRIKNGVVLVFNQKDFLLNRTELCDALNVLPISRHLVLNRQHLYSIENNKFKLVRSDFQKVIVKVKNFVDEAIQQFSQFEHRCMQFVPRIDQNGDLAILFSISMKDIDENQTQTDNYNEIYFKPQFKQDRYQELANDIMYARLLRFEFLENEMKTCYVYFILGNEFKLLKKSKPNVRFTKDYIVWRAEQAVCFALLKEIDETDDLKESFISNLLNRELGFIKVQMINFKHKFSDKNWEEIWLSEVSDQNYQLLVRDHKRSNLIQIQTPQLSLIWDLDENEEIDFIYNPTEFNIDNYILTGHQHYLCNGANKRPSTIDCNEDQSLFTAENGDEHILFKLYSCLDLITFFDLESQLAAGSIVNQIDCESLLANIEGATYFSMFYDKHSFIQKAVDQIKASHKQQDIFIRRLYFLLKLPCEMGNKSDQISLFAKRFKMVEQSVYQKRQTNKEFLRMNTFIVDPKTQLDLKLQTVIEYGVRKDEVLFNQILNLVTISDQFQWHDAIKNFQDWILVNKPKKLLARSLFRQKALLQTDSTKRVTALKSNDDDILFFGGDSTQLSDSYIRQQLEQNKDCKVLSKNKQLCEYSVYILELEWLIGNFDHYFTYLCQFDDKTLFDLKITKFLLNQLDFTRQVIVIHLLLSLINIALGQYYFSYAVTEFDIERTGYFSTGSNFDCFVRISTLILDTFNFIRVVINVSKVSTRNGKRVVIKEALFDIAQMILQQWVMFTHTDSNSAVSSLRIVQVASFITLINFFWIYRNLQIFEQTAIYVLMINQTILDIGYFFLLFCLVVFAFGNAIMIIDSGQANLYKETGYTSIVQNAFDNDMVDSVINQYLTGLGDFSYDAYENNPSKILLWVFFILATYFTQLLFFNMLITVMGTTFDEIMENAERQRLIAKTKILAKYVYVCKITAERLSKHRYIYIAFRQAQTQNSNTVTIEVSKRQLQQGFDKLREHLDQTIDESKMQEKLLSDQLLEIRNLLYNNNKEQMQKLNDLISQRDKHTSVQLIKLQDTINQFKN